MITKSLILKLSDKLTIPSGSKIVNVDIKEQVNRIHNEVSYITIYFGVVTKKDVFANVEFKLLRDTLSETCSYEVSVDSSYDSFGSYGTNVIIKTDKDILDTLVEAVNYSIGKANKLFAGEEENMILTEDSSFTLEDIRSAILTLKNQYDITFKEEYVQDINRLKFTGSYLNSDYDLTIKVELLIEDLQDGLFMITTKLFSKFGDGISETVENIYSASDLSEILYNELKFAEYNGEENSLFGDLGD